MKGDSDAVSDWPLLNATTLNVVDRALPMA